MGDSRQSGKINAASNAIPTSFGTGAGSRIITGIGRAKGILYIISTCEEFIKINFSAPNGDTAPTVVDAYIPAAASGSSAGLTLVDVNLGDAIFIASDGSSISTGIVRAFIV